MNFADFIWPHVGKTIIDNTQNDDLNKIDSASWGDDTGALLDEARRLRDTENNRKSAAETKSQIYLAALLALIPILVTLTEHDALKGITEFSAWYETAAFILFFAGIVYGAGAFFSSFRALTVQAYHRVDINEIVSSGTKESPTENITKEILKSVRKDRNNINRKISYVIVAHKQIFRMASLLLLALLLITLSPIFIASFLSFQDLIC